MKTNTWIHSFERPQKSMIRSLLSNHYQVLFFSLLWHLTEQLLAISTSRIVFYTTASAGTRKPQ